MAEHVVTEQEGWTIGGIFVKRKWVKLGAWVGGLGIVTLILYGGLNGIYNGAVQRENRLNAQYQDNQNYLSAYVSGFREQVSLLRAAGTQLDQVLTDAVKGRYDGKTNVQVGGGSLFSAILEAYPEASLAELQKSWGKVQTYVQAQREGYRNIQSKLLDMLREYDTWRQSGFIKHRFVSMMGVPTDRLVARVGDKQWKSQAALDRMFLIVLTAEAKAAYESGEQEPLEVNPT